MLMEQLTLQLVAPVVICESPSRVISVKSKNTKARTVDSNVIIAWVPWTEQGDRLVHRLPSECCHRGRNTKLNDINACVVQRPAVLRKYCGSELTAALTENRQYQ